METKSKNVILDSAVGAIAIFNWDLGSGEGIVFVKSDFNGLCVPADQKHCISMRAKQSCGDLRAGEVGRGVNQVAGGFEEMIVSSGQGLEDFVGEASNLVLMGVVPGRSGVLPSAVRGVAGGYGQQDRQDNYVKKSAHNSN